MRIFEAVVKIKAQISAVLLALMTLVSSSQFMVSAHFCGGDLKSFSLLSKADPCHAAKQIPPCHRAAKPCCEDLNSIHSSDEFNSINQVAQVPIIGFTIIPLFETFTSEANHTASITHLPSRSDNGPPTDFQILYSVFLI